MHKGYAFIQYTNEYDARNSVAAEDQRIYAGQPLGNHVNTYTWLDIYCSNGSLLAVVTVVHARCIVVLLIISARAMLSSWFKLIFRN